MGLSSTQYKILLSFVGGKKRKEERERERER
jgi:hypothetical protein